MKKVLVDEVASAPPGAGAVGELAGAAKEGPLALSVGVAQRPTGAVSDEVIERAHTVRCSTPASTHTVRRSSQPPATASPSSG